MADLEDRVLVLETTIKHIDESLTEIKNDIRGLNTKIDGVNTSLNAKIDGMSTSLNAKIDGMSTSLNAKIDGNLKWIIGVILVSWVTTIGAVISALFAVN